MKSKNKIARVFWLDAVRYTHSSQGVVLPRKMTVGELVKTTTDYVVIKDPITSSYSATDNVYVPETDARHTFFFIPRGMISRIVYKKGNN